MTEVSSDSTREMVPGSLGYEVLVADDNGVSSLPLPDRGELLIGRAEDADLRLVGTSVSRRHAILRVRGSDLTLEDLGSSNGTLIRGERVPRNREVPVSPGESLVIGEIVVVVRPRRFVSSRMAVSQALPPAESDEKSILRSSAMLALYRETDPIARSAISVLILGETGVGKDVLARSIHQRSDRRDQPFLQLNCAALPEALFESELFGYEKGAFTGATRHAPGLLLAASGGTVFLDELGELSPRLQAKLLQAVETRQILSLGSVKPRPIDVRFISATNRDLESDSRSGQFRSDLYYRLNGFTAVIPPLRERREDIVPLAQEFLRRTSQELASLGTPCLSDEAMARLLDHSWPGNVRELRNVIERAAVLAQGRPIRSEHLPLVKALPLPSRAPMPEPEGVEATHAFSNLSSKELAERERILNALAACSGNQGKAAEKLGVSRSTLLNRLDAYRIGRPRKRRG